MTSIMVAAREAADLTRQFQAHAHRPESGIQGDCYRTAIACVLGVERDSVPHSHDDMTGAEANEFHGKWLREQGLRRLFIPVNPAGSTSAAQLANEMWSRGDGLPMILTGHGRRGVNHCMVVHGEDDFWCPILGAVADTGLDGGALPDGYYWAEWLVRDPRP